MYITDMIRKENGIIQYAQLKPKRQKKKRVEDKKIETEQRQHVETSNVVFTQLFIAQ